MTARRRFRSLGSTNPTNPPVDARALRPSTLPQLLGYFAKLGAFGFGGPIALAEYMESDLVEERGWISKQDYMQGLALAELAPGPLAAQLAMYLGYSHSGILGATLAGFAFILPSFLMVLALAAAYSRFGGLPWVEAAFYGIGAAVMGIIARSGYKLAKRTVGKKRLLWALFAAMAAVTAVTGKELVWLFALCGLASLAAYAPRGWLNRARLAAAAPLGLLAPYGAEPASLGKLGALLVFFTKASLFVFGSGLAIVPFLYGGVVRDFHWLTERQFLDAVAVAMITPGPVVITAGFIGYLVAGLGGACLAAFGVFFPVYLFVVLLAPWYRRHGRDPRLFAFVEGVTAAAVGALVGAVLILGRGAIRDVPTAVIALVSLIALVRFKASEPLLVAVAGLAGVLLAPPAAKAAALDAPLAAVALPDGGAGIGFDDLGYAASLGKVLVPGGRTGLIFLLDPASGKISSIGGFSRSKAFAGGHGEGVTSADEGAGLVFGTDRDAGTVVAIAPDSGKAAATAKLGGGPDYVRWVAPTRELWVSEPDSERIEIFSLEKFGNRVSLHPAGTISVPGGPESLVIDQARGRAYTHTWKGETYAIDAKSRKIAATWKNGCSGSRGIALDEKRGWVFAGCAEGKATVMDAAGDGRILSALDAGAGVDVIAYDPARRRLFVPGAKSATLTVMAVAEEGKLSAVSTSQTAKGAHCVAADAAGGAWVCDPDRGRLLHLKAPDASAK